MEAERRRFLQSIGDAVTTPLTGAVLENKIKNVLFIDSEMSLIEKSSTKHWQTKFDRT